MDQSVGEKAKKLKDFGTTGFFGSLTKEALMEFQIKNNIKPSSGYFGQITRNYLKGIQN